MREPRRAPEGDLSSYAREHFAHAGMAHDVYRKGSGPAVLVLSELPNLSPYLLGLADRLAEAGLTAVVPDLFGDPGRDLLSISPLRRLPLLARVAVRICISREFNLFATGRSSPFVRFLRALAAHEHGRCGGPGVGVIGMCFSGGFALALAADPRVLAPVVAQPSLPFGRSARKQSGIDCGEQELTEVARRCEREGLQVLGLRFAGDRYSPAARFETLQERLGDGFVVVELPQAAGHPAESLSPHHSVLTFGLIDEPGEPTYEAREKVLGLLRSKLLRGADRDAVQAE